MRKVTALIFIEGDTEEEFYKIVCDKYLGGLTKKVMNLNGNFNIDSKILDKTFSFLDKHPENFVRIFCCIDRESRDHNPPINISHIVETFKNKSKKQCRVLSVKKIIATQMIESWFFYDMDGIYKFLSTPHSQRKHHKFRPPEKFTHIDLSNLFKRYDKIYIKGKRCQNFVNHLDIEKIYRDCQELQKGIELISKLHKLPKIKVK
ncbi:MAG: DUF4276 family protein [Deltaproteobacteria bacterium]|nr:DUF4276 family protein [Deltaproteobacteria bacterium]